MGISREQDDLRVTPLTRDVAFNRHSKDGGKHVSPFSQDRVDIGTDGIVVKLIQGINEDQLRTTLGHAVLATIGVDPDEPPEALPWEEMFKGGLQTALESQVIVFEVAGVSRTATHQIVRSRRAAFHQQSQRASYMGNAPNTRMPESVWLNQRARRAFLLARDYALDAYRIACNEDVAYQDARFILPEGTETYIMCEYSIREFQALYAYRACSMFQWEICHTVREMKRVLVEQHPWIDQYIRISCQTTEVCSRCNGTGVDIAWALGPEDDRVMCPQCGGSGYMGNKCTFQGWENVEDQCTFPWAQEELRVYKPDRSLRIGG